jgi:hypothetical protein
MASRHVFLLLIAYCGIFLASSVFGQDAATQSQSGSPSAQGSQANQQAQSGSPSAQGSQANQQAQSGSPSAQGSQANPQAQTNQPSSSEGKSAVKTEVKPGTKTGKLGTIEEQLEELRSQIEKLRKEAEARNKLEVTEAEKSETEKEILNAAGRQYTMMQKNTLAIVFGASYQYYSSEVISNNQFIAYADNNVTTSLEVEYAWRNNLTSSFLIPFVYKWDKQGTSSSLSATDLGDMSMGLSWQPIQASGDFPSLILSGSIVLPTGKSPYDIVPNEALSTGSGFYGISVGMSVSQPIDPLVVFGGLSYLHDLPVSDIKQNWASIGELQKVTPGDAITVNVGLGEALTYMVAASLTWSYTYTFNTEYEFAGGSTSNTGTMLQSTISLNTSWKISPKRSFTLGFSWGLTSSDPTVGINFTMPFEFPTGG